MLRLLPRCFGTLSSWLSKRIPPLFSLMRQGGLGGCRARRAGCHAGGACRHRAAGHRLCFPWCRSAVFQERCLHCAESSRRAAARLSYARHVQAGSACSSLRGHGYLLRPTPGQLPGPTDPCGAFHQGKWSNNGGQTLQTSMAANSFHFPCRSFRDRSPGTLRSPLAAPGHARGRPTPAASALSRHWAGRLAVTAPVLPSG